MLNVKKLLLKICQNIVELIQWQRDRSSQIQHISQRGETVIKTISDYAGDEGVVVSITSYTSLAKVTLTPGIWLCQGNVYWPDGGDNTNRLIGIGPTENSSMTHSRSQKSVKGGVTRQSICCILENTYTRDMFLTGYQASDDLLTVTTAALRCIKLW